MYGGRRVLAVVPARGGSKGIKLKNLRTLAGLSLVGHVGVVTREVREIDLAVLSTDHEEIAAAGRCCGLSVPFVRPAELSGDQVGDLDVLRHALLASEEHAGVTFDVIIMLQPTSPLRTPDHVRSVIKKLSDEGWDAVWTVSPADMKYHPLKQLRLEVGGSMSYYDPRGAGIIARQQLEQLYYRNGAAYAFTRDCLSVQGAILGLRSSAVVVQEPMVSIDTEGDLLQAEQLFQKRTT